MRSILSMQTANLVYHVCSCLAYETNLLVRSFLYKNTSLSFQLSPLSHREMPPPQRDHDDCLAESFVSALRAYPCSILDDFLLLKHISRSLLLPFTSYINILLPRCQSTSHNSPVSTQFLLNPQKRLEAEIPGPWKYFLTWRIFCVV